MVKIVPEYELDYFDWLVRQRLINFPAMPVKENGNKNHMDTIILVLIMKMNIKN